MNDYKRLAHLEASAAAQRSEQVDVLRQAYQAACDAQDTDQAAELARRIRNKLLEQSDSQLTLDRIGLDTSSATKFIASLVKIFSGSWAVYRQQLRDLPDQEGWPFRVEFPAAPDEDTDMGQ